MECKYKESCGHDHCNIYDCHEFKAVKPRKTKRLKKLKRLFENMLLSKDSQNVKSIIDAITERKCSGIEIFKNDLTMFSESPSVVIELFPEQAAEIQILIKDYLTKEFKL